MKTGTYEKLEDALTVDCETGKRRPDGDDIENVYDIVSSENDEAYTNVIFDLLKLLGWKIPSEEKPPIELIVFCRWNPLGENYNGIQITKESPLGNNGMCKYGITHWKEIN